jgi:uncharacterized protein YdhG (YjbR/CyaY superfamily)
MPDRTATENKTFTEEERAAIQERAREVKKEARRGTKAAKVDGEADLLAKIGEMPEPDRAMAERIHAVVKANAPELEAKTWYGMPAYARGGKVICFFQPAAKFKTRYATIGFNEDAKLDDGHRWATSWALTDLTEADEPWLAELVRKAVG